MQTILGSNGQIGHELANVLYQEYTQNLRLVSRHPQAIHKTDQVVKANLVNYQETLSAITGSDIVYFTVGLPMDTALWQAQFPLMVANVIKACLETRSKLVFFDNTYMYAKNDDLQSESSPFLPEGLKANVRADLATQVLNAMQKDHLEAVICRAPEFYGPAQTQSITNQLIFNRIKTGKKPLVPLSASTQRTLIWTPDASRALALIGNTPTAYQQTWHLPVAGQISYHDLIALSANVLGKAVPYWVLPFWQFKLGSWFNPAIKELLELLPRYRYNNIFTSEKFDRAFPDFKSTSYQEGVQEILRASKPASEGSVS